MANGKYFVSIDFSALYLSLFENFPEFSRRKEAMALDLLAAAPSSQLHQAGKRKLMELKDKSGVDTIIVKKQPYQLLNTNREFFSILMPPTFINWLMNLRKLGQISSPFGISCE